MENRSFDPIAMVLEMTKAVNGQSIQIAQMSEQIRHLTEKLNESILANRSKDAHISKIEERVTTLEHFKTRAVAYATLAAFILSEAVRYAVRTFSN